MLDKIIKTFESGISKDAVRLTDGKSIYAYRTNEILGIIVKTQISQTYVRKLYSVELRIQKFTELDSGNYLFLSCSKRDHLYKFAYICETFLQSGINFDSLEDVDKWWGDWREFMGNIIRSTLSYPFLSEMHLFQKIIAKISPTEISWGAQNLHDIEFRSFALEVKSTLKRTERSIKISNEFQLESGSKSLFIIFFRWELNPAGEHSIQGIWESITDQNLRDYFKERLHQNDLEPGDELCSQKYNLLETSVYRVDENFPKLTMASLRNIEAYEHINQISYSVNLHGLQSIPLDDFLNTIE